MKYYRVIANLHSYGGPSFLKTGSIVIKQSPYLLIRDI
jgi:hypothetical protein